MELQVVKSNHIINASYRLSVLEQRIILTCMSKVPRHEVITDQTLYSISAAELAEMTGGDIKTAYRDLKVASKRLFDRSVTLYKEPDGSQRHPSKMLTRWCQSVNYIDAEGRVELRFGTDIIPYINMLSEQFTRYALSAVINMSNSYAIRIYEHFAQWRGTKQEITITVDELKSVLQIEDKYPLFADLKRWVIEKAIQEINEATDLKASYTTRKTGRKVSHIIFKFREKPKPKSEKTKTLTKAQAEKLARPGESYAELYGRLKVGGYTIRS